MQAIWSSFHADFALGAFKAYPCSMEGLYSLMTSLETDDIKFSIVIWTKNFVPSCLINALEKICPSILISFGGM